MQPNDVPPINGYILRQPSKDDILQKGIYVNRKYMPEAYRELYEKGDPITYSRGLAAANRLKNVQIPINYKKLDQNKWDDYVTIRRNHKTYFDPKYNGIYGAKENGDIIRIEPSDSPSDLIDVKNLSVVRNYAPDLEREEDVARSNFKTFAPDNPIGYYKPDIHNNIVKQEAQKKGLTLVKETEDRITANRMLDGFVKMMRDYGVTDRDLEEVGIKGGYDGIDANIFNNLNQFNENYGSKVYRVLRSFLGAPITNYVGNEQLKKTFIDAKDKVGSFVRDHSSNSPYLFVAPDNEGNMNLNIPNTYANGGRLTTRKDDNIFSPAHIFADGGEMGNSRPVRHMGTRGYIAHMGTPVTLEEINRQREAYYAEQEAKALQEAELRNYVRAKRNTVSTQMLDSSPAPNYRIEDDRVVFSGPVRISDYYDIMNARKEAQDQEEKQKRDWLIEYRKEKTIDQKKTIEQLALDTIRGKYGNGKERKIALGDNYSAVQKRIDEILRDRQNKNRDLDENPRSVIRADGEVKRHIGETDKYDIYL